MNVDLGDDDLESGAAPIDDAMEAQVDKLKNIFGDNSDENDEHDDDDDDDDVDTRVDSPLITEFGTAGASNGTSRKKRSKKRSELPDHGFGGVNSHKGYAESYETYYDNIDEDDGFEYDSVNKVEAGATAGADGNSKKGGGAPGPAALKKLPFRQLYNLGKRQGRYLVFAFVALAVSAGTNLALPFFVGQLIDIVIDPMSHPNALSTAVAEMFVFVLVSSISSVFRRSLFEVAGQRVVVDVRRDLFNAIIQQEVAFFDRVRTGELVNRLADDATVLSNTVTVNVSMLLRFSAQFFIALIFLFTISWQLTLCLLAILPLISVAAWAYGKFIRVRSKEVQDALAKSTEIATEVIGEIRTVRSFSGEERERAKYFGQIDVTLRKYVSLAIAGGLFVGISSLIAGVALCGIMWFGGSLVQTKVLTPGQLTSYMMFMATVVTAVGALSGLFGDLMKAVGATERIFQLTGRKPRVRHRGGERVGKVKGHLAFHDVDFSYPSRPDVQVLRHLSFEAPPGKVVALVGPSGGGKTTCMALIQGFYIVNGGRITLDGRDVASLDPGQLRRVIGTVRQEPALFASTIADNIRYGRPNATRDQVERAARLANAYDFIMEFPEGFDTLVGERGIRLSGGQKQRIAISRAIVLNPRILCLDEATSALDGASEKLVKDALEKLMKGRTTLVIAHRLSTVVNADNVVVIDKGQVAEQGTHDELLQKNGLYKELVDRQLLADQ